MAKLSLRLLLIGAVGLWFTGLAPASAQPAEVNSIAGILARLKACWMRPDPARIHADIDITVVVSFKRSGEILGRPRVTYESEQPDDNDRLLYRIAAMEALQRCTPMPFTESMAGAAAGRPFAIRFHNRKPQPAEKRAWLIQKIL